MTLVRRLSQTTLHTTLAVAIGVTAGYAQASGFALNEQGASNMGVANAGAVANPENASIAFFNPAGMTRLEGTHVSFGAAVLNINTDFSGSATGIGGAPVEGNNGGEFVPTAVLPHLYITHRLRDEVAVGLSLHAPYGLKADYDDDFVGRFFADKTELEVIALSPAIGFDDGNGFSMGVSANLLYAKGRLSKFQDFTALGVSEPGYFDIEGDDLAVTFTFGLMYSPNERWDLGMTYRTGTEIKLEGDAVMTNAPQFNLQNGTVSGTATLTEKGMVPLEIPESLSFGARFRPTGQVTLLAGATWTRWSRFEALDILSTQSNAGTPNETISFLGARSFGQDGMIGHVSQNWKNTWAGSVGAVWQVTPAAALKLGYGYQRSPINPDFRTARIPSDDRQWLALGGQFHERRSGWTLDAALGYFLMDKVDVAEQEYDVNDRPLNNGASLNGTYDISAWTVALQLSKQF